jgi:hypothetical protein
MDTTVIENEDIVEDYTFGFKIDRKFVTLFTLAVIVLSVLINVATQGQHLLTDPRKGHVLFSDYSDKYCVGTTLIHETSDFSVISKVLNSPSCK